MKPSSIQTWQERFFAEPLVWMVVDSDWVVSNVYASKAGAQIEIDWHKSHGRLKFRLLSMHIHTDALARERWT